MSEEKKPLDQAKISRILGSTMEPLRGDGIQQYMEHKGKAAGNLPTPDPRPQGSASPWRPMIDCPYCDGTGIEPCEIGMPPDYPCLTCNGAGKVPAPPAAGGDS